jgi:hypothetical protein
VLRQGSRNEVQKKLRRERSSLSRPLAQFKVRIQRSVPSVHFTSGVESRDGRRASQLSHIPVSVSCRVTTRRTRNKPVVVPESRLGHGGRRGPCHSFGKNDVVSSELMRRTGK